MRKITALQTAVFMSIFAVITALSLATTALVFGDLPLGDFRGLVLVAMFVLSLYMYAIVAYRLFIRIAPLAPGEIAEESHQEFIYHIYILFFLIVFYPVMRSGFVPAPLMRLFYLALGTRLGRNTYTQGILHDPQFIEIGSNTTIGQFAVLVPHVIEGQRLAHYPIRLGNNVTVGTHAVVLADVVIGDYAMIASGAVVAKGSRIGDGEVWGGVPAKRLRGGTLN